MAMFVKLFVNCIMEKRHKLGQHWLIFKRREESMEIFVGSHFSEIPGLRQLWIPWLGGIENVAPDTLVRLG